MVEIKDLTMRFGKQLLFENVNLSLDKGRRYGLIGANGAGKSTLLKILSGQIEASSGEILIQSGLKIGVLGQDQFAFESFSVKDAVLYGNKRLYDAVREKTQLYEAGEFNDEINERLGELEMICAEEDPAYEYETRIEKILSSLGLNDFDKKMSEIETSDKFKVLLAQVLFPRPDVLFLDEPASALDIKNQDRVLSLIANLRSNSDASIVFTTHQPNHALAVADRTLILRNDLSYNYGASNEILTEAALSSLYGVQIKTAEFDVAGEQTTSITQIFSTQVR